jgi:hypothetical protein
VRVEEFEGEPIEIWQYGQCYLGVHLEHLYLLRWQGLLSETLAQAMRDPEDLAPLAAGLAQADIPEVAWKLAAALIEKNAAAPYKHDPARVHFDEARVREELGRLVMAKAH